MMSERLQNNISPDTIQDYEIPDGLNDLLHEFAVSVLLEKPNNLHDFAADYFTRLRDTSRVKTIPMYIVVDDDEEAGEPEQLRKLTTKNQQSSRRKSVSAERYNPEEDNSDDETESLPIHPKTDKQREQLTRAVKNILLFRTLDDDQRMTVIDAMVQKSVHSGDVIISQGDDGDYFYVIGSGNYDIFINTENGQKKKVNSFNGEGSFGELALMYSQPRSATVKAASTGTLWALDRKSFQRIVSKESFRNRQMYEKLLNKVPFLECLSEDEVSSVVDGLYTKVYYADEAIIKVGEEGDGIYFILDGLCSVRIVKNKDEGEEEVRKLQQGQYFGELALLDNSHRTASIYAINKVKCGFLARDAFERLLGPCRDLMKRATVGFEFGTE